jgi:predicted nucleic acid-binding protein
VTLLDTHIVVWLAFDQDQISRKARASIDDARKNGDGLAICDISFFELAMLVNKRRVRLDISLESFLREVEARFVVVPITSRACRPVAAGDGPQAFAQESLQLLRSEFASSSSFRKVREVASSVSQQSAVAA